MHWAALKGTRGGGISLCRILVFFVFLLTAISPALRHKSPSGCTEKNQLNLQHTHHSITRAPDFPGRDREFSEIKRTNLMAVVMVLLTVPIGIGGEFKENRDI